MAGSLLRAWACVSVFISWRAVDFECVNRGFHARHHCSESSRTRHHLRLFRSCQPTLEFPVSSCDQRRNSGSASRAWFFESVEEAFIGRALLPASLGSATEAVVLQINARDLRARCEYSV